MRLVLDANVAVKWVVPEDLSDKATLLRDDFRNSVHELIAPDCWPTEVAHALTKAARSGGREAPCVRSGRARLAASLTRPVVVRRQSAIRVWERWK